MGSIVGFRTAPTVVINESDRPITSVERNNWYNAEGGMIYPEYALAAMDIAQLESAVKEMEKELAYLKKNKDDNKGEIELVKIRIKYAEDLIKAKKKGDKDAEKEAADRAKKDKEKLYSNVDSGSFWDKLFGGSGSDKAATAASTFSPYIQLPSSSSSASDEPKKDRTLLYVGLGAGVVSLFVVAGIVIYKLRKKSPK